MVYYALLISTHAITAQGQNRAVTGKIKDAQGATLPGVNIVLKGTATGTVSDANGDYAIDVGAGNNVLVFSFVGYTPQEIPVGASTTLDVVLQPDTKTLSEVIVTGYSSQRRSDVTGAIAVVGLDKIKDIPKANVLQQLQGRVPGLYIESSGQPSGQTGQILIRGLNTLGDNSPLYIIDGVPATANEVSTGRGAANGSTTKNVSPLQNLDPNSIESIQVLKDASASSIYGARASNGVIIVTTRQGKGKLKVQFSTSTTFQERFGKIDVCNTLERGRALWQASINDGTDPANHSALYSFDYTGTGAQAVLKNVTPVSWLGGPENLTPAQVPGTDWQKEIYQTGHLNNSSLTLSGGSETASALLQVGYLTNQGVKKYSDFSKMNLRVNTSYKLFNGVLKIGENLNLAKTRETPEPTDLGGVAMDYLGTYVQPILPVYRTDGEWAGPIGSGFSDRNNPLHIMYINRNNKDNSVIMFGNVYAEVNPIDNLTIRTSYGLDYTNSNNRWVQEKYKEGFLTQNVNSLSIFKGERVNLTWTNTANYSLDLGRSSFNFLVGAETISEDYQHSTARKQDFAFQDPDYFQLDAGTGSSTAIGDRTGFQLLSYFGKAGYSLADRYLFSATLRYDGSSRFGTKNQFGLFPAATVGWKISNEKFMSALPMISNLKLRAGIGRVGNQKIGNTARFGIYAPNYGQMDFRSWYGNWRTIGSAYDLEGKNRGVLPSGYVSTQQENENLKWETTDEVNVGIDFGFWNHHVKGSFDYFTRNTTGILINPPYAGVIGEGGSRWVNGASTQNKGFEFLLGYQNTTDDFSYGATATMTHFTDKITDLPESVVRSYPGNAKETILGRSQKAIFGYVTDGLFQNQEEVNTHAEQAGKGVGRIRYKDLNNDRKIDAYDQTWLGTTLPGYECGLGLDLGYKNWSLSLFFQGVFKKTINDGIKGDYTKISNGMNFGKGAFEAWTPSNPNAALASLTLIDANNEGRTSDYWYVNGSYAKLRTLQLTYQLPGELINRLKLAACNLYVVGGNLFAIKDNTGVDRMYAPDPEQPQLAYPLTRNFTLGLTISF